MILCLNWEYCYHFSSSRCIILSLMMSIPFYELYGHENLLQYLLVTLNDFYCLQQVICNKAPSSKKVATSSAKSFYFLLSFRITMKNVSRLLHLRFWILGVLRGEFLKLTEREPRLWSLVLKPLSRLQKCAAVMLPHSM